MGAATHPKCLVCLYGTTVDSSGAPAQRALGSATPASTDAELPHALLAADGVAAREANLARLAHADDALARVLAALAAARRLAARRVAARAARLPPRLLLVVLVFVF